jgi:hypothetical protein
MPVRIGEDEKRRMGAIAARTARVCQRGQIQFFNSLLGCEIPQ